VDKGSPPSGSIQDLLSVQAPSAKRVHRTRVARVVASMRAFGFECGGNGSNYSPHQRRKRHRSHDRSFACTFACSRYKSKAPGWLAGPERFNGVKMNTTTYDQIVNSHPFAPSRKVSYFNVKQRIRDLGLRRACTIVLTTIWEKIDRSRDFTLSTERFPVTIAALVEESQFSRSYVLEVLNELEAAGHVERIRHRRQLPSGEWINDPTTYQLLLDVNEAELPTRVVVTKEARPRAAHVAPVASPQSTHDEPLPSLAPEASPPAREPVKVDLAPLQSHEDAILPESPTDDPEVNRLADEISTNGKAFLRHAEKAKPRTVEQAKKALDLFKYTLANVASYVCERMYISESDIMDCVEEWVVKCVEKNLTQSPSYLAERLQSFFYGKGEALSKMRVNRLAS